MKQFNRTYAEVNLDAIRHNIDECVMMTGISRRTGSLEFNGKINSEYKITTS